MCWNKYDEWKLDNGYSDKYECDHCEEILNDSDLSEVNIKDIDGYTDTLWLCEKCIEKKVWI